MEALEVEMGRLSEDRQEVLAELEAMAQLLSQQRATHRRATEETSTACRRALEEAAEEAKAWRSACASEDVLREQLAAEAAACRREASACSEQRQVLRQGLQAHEASAWRRQSQLLEERDSAFRAKHSEEHHIQALREQLRSSSQALVASTVEASALEERVGSLNEQLACARTAASFAWAKEHQHRHAAASRARQDLQAAWDDVAVWQEQNRRTESRLDAAQRKIAQLEHNLSSAQQELSLQRRTSAEDLAAAATALAQARLHFEEELEAQSSKALGDGEVASAA